MLLLLGFQQYAVYVQEKTHNSNTVGIWSYTRLWSGKVKQQPRQMVLMCLMLFSVSLKGPIAANGQCLLLAILLTLLIDTTGKKSKIFENSIISLEWHSSEPRPTVSDNQWSCTKVHTLIDIISLNKPDFIHQEPWIIPWETHVHLWYIIFFLYHPGLLPSPANIPSIPGMVRRWDQPVSSLVSESLPAHLQDNKKVRPTNTNHAYLRQWQYLYTLQLVFRKSNIYFNKSSDWFMCLQGMAAPPQTSDPITTSGHLDDQDAPLTEPRHLAIALQPPNQSNTPHRPDTDPHTHIQPPKAAGPGLGLTEEQAALVTTEVGS